MSSPKSFLVFLSEEQVVALIAVLMHTGPEWEKIGGMGQIRPRTEGLLHSVYMKLCASNLNGLLEARTLQTRGRIYVNR